MKSMLDPLKAADFYNADTTLNDGQLLKKVHRCGYSRICT